MTIHPRNKARPTRHLGCPALSAGLALILTAAALAADMPVSPGDLVEIFPVSSACPTFSWSTDSTAGIELVVAPYSAPEETMLQQELPAGATSWTPPANRCLPPGQYVWFFRELDSKNAEWSDALSFEVSSVPTLDEVERARNVLERFISSGGATADNHAVAAATQSGQKNSSSASAAPANNELSRTTSTGSSGNKTMATVDSPAAVISSAAVTGISDFSNVAGALVENTVNGVDLVLGGAVQGHVKENSWQLDSANAQTFDFLNPSGNLTLRVNGNPVQTSASASAGEPISMFGAFGGNGTVDKTVAGVENFSSPIAYFRNLTIPAGTTFNITQPVAFIAVSGTCDIAGLIKTAGSGQNGGSSVSSSGPAPGYPGVNAAGAGSGYGMHGGMHRVAIPMAIAGAGGGGGGTGNAPSQRGGDGGGAEALGGEGGYAQDGTLNGRAASVDWNKRHLMTGGATDNIQFPPGLLRTDFFINFLYFPGAGGGGGAVDGGSSTGGKGGDGGGNIYLECRKASFTGSIDVGGVKGGSGLAFGGKAGGGGGGGGGIGVIRTLELLQNTGSVQVAGGLGGNGAGGGGAGGNGRQGLIEIVEL